MTVGFRYRFQIQGWALMMRYELVFFDPFSPPNPLARGTGLRGLSTSYQIIQAQHGGRIYQREIQVKLSSH
jgi:hypothetical protein